MEPPSPTTLLKNDSGYYLASSASASLSLATDSGCFPSSWSPIPSLHIFSTFSLVAASFFDSLSAAWHSL